ncbi:MAG: tryptophan-rich sensory protein [Cryomorphaceae bacterium]
MKKFFAAFNAVLILVVIYVNYWVGVNGLNGNTVGSLSTKYDTLFTPAGYAFSIWGLIFFLLLVHAYYQIKAVFISKKYNDFVVTLGPWLALANLANIAWLYAWLMEYTGLSVFLMLIILGALTTAVIRLNLQRWDAPFVVIRNIWWPITVYYGWITVATIANISAYLVKTGWNETVDEVQWSVIMVVAAAVLNLAILFLRSMREFALVGLWAIGAICIRHWGEQTSIQWTALMSAMVLALAIVGHNIYHWKTHPMYKWLNRNK